MWQKFYDSKILSCLFQDISQAVYDESTRQKQAGGAIDKDTYRNEAKMPLKLVTPSCFRKFFEKNIDSYRKRLKKKDDLLAVNKGSG